MIDGAIAIRNGPPRRVVIVGSGGAGKSTLAREIGVIVGVPVVHLDAHYWQPGWIESSKDEWPAVVQRLAAADEWVIDGNYSGTMGPRLARADLIVFLDYPRALCVYRAVKRWLTHLGTTRPDMAAGCPERLDWEFIEWILNFPEEDRLRLLGAVAKHGVGKPFVRLVSPAETREYVSHLQAQVRQEM